MADGRSAGAVYTAAFGGDEFTTTVPSAAFPPAIPFTSQLIAVPLAMHNVAVSVCVWPNERLALAGEIRFAHVIVTLAVPVLTGSATLLAVIVTFEGDGGVTGAVYVAESAPLETVAL